MREITIWRRSQCDFVTSKYWVHCSLALEKFTEAVRNAQRNELIVMLPSTGYFKTINCPFYESGSCDRPYCHFKHARKDDSANVQTSSALEATQILAKNNEVEATITAVAAPNPNDLEKLVTEAVKKVLAGHEVTKFPENIVTKVVEELKPTLASGSLASSSTTPDPPLPSTIGKHTGVPSCITKCVYNPTPIAELKKRHIPIPTYMPMRENKLAAKRKTSPDRNKSWLSLIHGSGNNFSTNTEAYSPIAIGSSDMNSSQSYVPTVRSSPANSYEDSNSNEYFPKKSKEEYLPKVKKRREEYVPRRVKHPLKTVQQLEETMEDETVLDEFAKKFETVDNTTTVAKVKPVLSSNEESQEYVDIESKFSDEELVNDSVAALTNEVRELKEQVSKIKYQEEKENTDVVQIEKEEEREPLSHKSNSSTSHKKEHSSRYSSKSRTGESKKEKSRSDKPEKDSSHKEKSKDSDRGKSRDSKSKSSSESRSKDKHSSSKSKEHSSSSRDKDKGKEKDRDKEKEKSKDSKRDSKDSKSKDTKDVKNKSKKDSRTDKEKEKESSRDSKKDKHKSDKYDKHRSKSSSSSSKTDKHKSHKSEEKHHSNHKSSSSNHKHSSSSKKPSKPKDNRERSESDNDDRVNELHYNFEEEEENPIEISDSDHDVEEECLKIFQEYEVSDHTKDAPKKESYKRHIEEIDDPEDVTRRKRVAHPSAVSTSVRKPVSDLNRTVVNPHLKMYERLRALKAAVAEKCAEKVAEYVPEGVKPSASNNWEMVPPKKLYEPSSSAKKDSHLNGNGKIRIAHVPYAMSLALAKKKVMETASKPVEIKTVAQTTKGGLRVAHIPQVATPLIRPEPIEVTSQKFPVNIRQFYVNTMHDICVQIYTNGEDASQRAVREEFACHERCRTLNVYKSSCSLAAHRLRKEVDQGSEATSSPATPSGMVSHEAVLAGKSKGSWSVIKTKRAIQDLHGVSLYLMLSKWILTSQQLSDNGFPRPHPDGPKGRAKVYVTNTRNQSILSKVPNERFCSRCNQPYMVNKHGMPVRPENCIYHWGRKFTIRGEGRYSCCQQDGSASGCGDAKTHVWDHVDYENLRGYVTTLPKDIPEEEQGIYALDCEMCYTTQGLELARVTIINEDCNVVYETFVKPDNPIIDYNTRFSGITEENMWDVSTSLRDVQATLLTMVSSKTILVGHSLESDFKALKLIHDTVVDTSVMFPHRNGYPQKRALKNLCSEYLQKIIQNDVGGHDSNEDAVACMQLVLWKVKDEAKLM